MVFWNEWNEICQVSGKRRNGERHRHRGRCGKNQPRRFVTVRFLHTKELAAQSYLTFVSIDENTGRPVPHGAKLDNLTEEMKAHQMTYRKLTAIRE